MIRAWPRASVHLAPALSPPAPLPVGAAAGPCRVGALATARVSSTGWGTCSVATLNSAPPAAYAASWFFDGLLVTIAIGHRTPGRPGVVVCHTGSRGTTGSRPRRGRAPLPRGRPEGRGPKAPAPRARTPHDRRPRRSSRDPACHCGGIDRHDRRRRTRGRAHAPRRGILRQPGATSGDRARASGAVGSRRRLPTIVRRR